MKRKGIWIDSNLSGKGLSPLDKMLFSQICYYSKEEGFCRKSDKILGFELEVSEKSVRNSLAFLLEKGLINRVTEKQKGNTRTLSPTVNITEPLRQELPNPTVNITEPLRQELPNPTVNITEAYKEEITIKQLKEQSINNKEESEFSKNENYALLSENEFIKSELEKANEKIKALEEKEKKGKKESSAKKESFVYDFPEDFSEEVTGLFMNFIGLRNSTKGKAIKTQLQIDLLIKKLIPFTDTVRKVSIENAIEGNWTSFFPKPEVRSNVVYHNRGKDNGFVAPNAPKQPDKYQIANDRLLAKLEASMTPI